MTGAFHELAVQFGRSAPLIGILSRPPSELPIRGPAVVILNTGIAHRVGHHRMYVTMARKLAALSYLVFRFDLSGIGDSPSRGDSLSLLEVHQADVHEALDWLTANFNVNEAVLVGLCSGADIALSYGHSDKRVISLVLLDPTVPPTARFYTHYIRARLMRLQSWWSFVTGRGRIWQALSGRVKSVFDATPEQPSSEADHSLRKELEQLCQKSLDRNLKLLFVLTGGPLDGRQSYREQIFDALPNVPLRGRVSVEHFKDADHTFTSESARARLQELVLGWIEALSSPPKPAGN